jgi:hypothetical protein
LSDVPAEGSESNNRISDWPGSIESHNGSDDIDVNLHPGHRLRGRDARSCDRLFDEYTRDIRPGMLRSHALATVSENLLSKSVSIVALPIGVVLSAPGRLLLRLAGNAPLLFSRQPGAAR